MGAVLVVAVKSLFTVRERPEIALTQASSGPPSGRARPGLGHLVGGLLGGSAGRLGEVHTLPAHGRRSEDDDEGSSLASSEASTSSRSAETRGAENATHLERHRHRPGTRTSSTYPSDYPKLIQPILDDHAEVVFGSRFIGGAARLVLYFWHAVGNRVLTALSNLCTNIDLTDMGTGYKVFRLRGRNPTLSGCQPTARVSGS